MENGTMSDSTPETDDGYPVCDQCDKALGTNGGCLQCLYAYEAGVGPQAERDGR